MRVRQAVSELTRSKEPMACAVGLANSMVSHQGLIEGVTAWNWIKRYAVSRNPQTPEPLLRTLAQDVNRVVRASARERLARQQATR
jgi:hypothetical protein